MDVWYSGLMKRSFLDYFFICHKRPDRSLFYKGKQFPVCARCTGIFFGYILGFFTALLYQPSILVNILLFVPLGGDGIIQLLTKYESTNFRRIITGLLTGMAWMFLLANFAIFINGLKK